MPGPVRTEFLSSQGMDESVFPASAYLSADQLVAAAMAGLDRGEAITIPSIPDVETWEKIEVARKEFMAATLSGKVAIRYQ